MGIRQSWYRLKNRINGARVGASMGLDALDMASDYIEDSLEDGRSSSLSKEIGKAKKLDVWSAHESQALAELELALEDTTWRDLTSPYGLWTLSRAALNKMISLSRIMYLMNPLIRRAVTVQELYVWGSGCEVKAKSPEVQTIIDDVFKEPKNQTVIGEAWAEREREQRIDGNQFFMFFVDMVYGTARVRLLPVEQVEDIIFDPDDSKKPWYYKRAMAPASLDTNGMPQVIGKVASDGLYHMYFPDIDYEPVEKPTSLGGDPVRWDVKILHVKTGGLSSMKFGMPECFPAINWARAYKKILENFATILQAYARIAMKISGLPGEKGVAAAKSKLGTAINGLSNVVDKNPPPNTASTIPLSGNVDIQPVKTARSTTGPDEARALRSMVAAGTDTPEHFFGDSDIGNFATSKTLDRPTELKMVSRQTMWEDVQHHMIRKLVEWSCRAYFGKLRQAGWRAERSFDRFDATLVYKVVPANGQTTDVEVRFPAIIQADVVERVRAVVQAATLGGSKAEGIFPNRKYLFKLLCIALGLDKSDQLADEMYPQAVQQGFIDPKEELAIQRLKAQKSSKATKQGAD